MLRLSVHRQEDMQMAHNNSAQGIRDSFTVVNGIIQNPGKFEREPIYVPYYWNCALEGMADEDEGGEFVFELDAAERVIWPEIPPGYDYLCLHETSDGFVYSVLTNDRFWEHGGIVDGTECE